MISKHSSIFIFLIGVLFFGISFSYSEDTTVQDASNIAHIQYWMKTLETHPLVIVRKQAARQLGNIQNSMALPSLIKCLKDVNEDVRIQCAYSLGRMGDTNALQPLYQLTETGSKQIQTAGKNAIDKINAHEDFVRQRKQKLKDSENVPDKTSSIKKNF